MQAIWNDILIGLAVIALMAIVLESAVVAVKCWKEWRGSGVRNEK